MFSEEFLDKKPSEEANFNWIYAERIKGRQSDFTSRVGKWLIFVKRKDVDDLWVKIRKATEAGLLGFAAKVSTAFQGENYPNKKDTHVICVYTKDWKNKKDVMRVRKELRLLGIENKIPYKTDEDTLKGKYATKRGERISKYYE